jgi:hypothetical protein
MAHAEAVPDPLDANAPTVMSPVALLNAVMAPAIQFVGDTVLAMMTDWPSENPLPVCCSVKVRLPVPTVKLVVLVALVPGALSALAALAAASLALVVATPA